MVKDKGNIMSNLPEHIEDFKQRTFQSTMDKNAANLIKDKDVFRGGGRRHLVAIDNLKADQEVARAEKGESSYD